VYEAVPDGVKAIWAKLKPKVEESPIAQSAAEKVAIAPDNAKRVTALELAIEDLLTELATKEPEWVASLQELLKIAEAESATGKNAGTINAQTIYGVIQGDNAKFVLIAIPQADGQNKPRPVLLLREMPKYRDFLVCGISSQLQQYLPDFDELIQANDPDFVETGLIKPSLVRLNFLAIARRTEVIGRLGTISLQRHR
jgi:mRNA interferase MazF